MARFQSVYFKKQWYLTKLRRSAIRFPRSFSASFASLVSLFKNLCENTLRIFLRPIFFWGVEVEEHSSSSPLDDVEEHSLSSVLDDDSVRIRFLITAIPKWIITNFTHASQKRQKKVGDKHASFNIITVEEYFSST